MYQNIIKEIIWMKVLVLETFGAIVLLLTVYFMTLAAFSNLLDDWSSLKHDRKVWIKSLIKNLLVLLFLLLISIFGTYCFILDIKHPEHKVDVLKSNVEGSQRALDKYLEEHPEYKE